MSELREMLARRLVNVAGRMFERPGVLWPNYEALADECIRQMDFAYNYGLNDASDAYNHWRSKRKKWPQIAPDDWEVPK